MNRLRRAAGSLLVRLSDRVEHWSRDLYDRGTGLLTEPRPKAPRPTGPQETDFRKADRTALRRWGRDVLEDGARPSVWSGWLK